jgi:hypothetical protein
MLVSNVDLDVRGRSDRLFINPFATSTKTQPLDKTSMKNLEMYRWSTKRSEAEIPRSHEDLYQTPFQVVGVGLK